MGSFATSLSGLQANSQDLEVISNNLANLNTTAYKGATANFQDLFYQQLGTSGDGNAIQVGVGTQIGSIPADFTEGNIQSTGVSTDVAIEGSGFFVGQTTSGQDIYFRAGDLSTLANGTLVAPDGSEVLGFPAVNGIVNPSGSPAPIVIAAGAISPPLATANAAITMNLDSGTPVGGTFSTALTVYDSLGAPHVLTYNFTNTGPLDWNYSITIPAADVGGAAGAAPVVVKAGTMTFSGTGQLLTPAADVAAIPIAGLADGANTLTFNWNLYAPGPGGAGLITQDAAASSASDTQQDGFASGSLVSFSIGADGTIDGSFSNGQTQALGQILLANFPNLEGLSRIGTNEFAATLSSGAANIGVAGTGGRGTLSGGALEASNVDISTQFANLIVAESGYQANAKVVTTLDTVIQDTINLIL
jgi:flagellar hook protein FlgE